MAGATEQSDSCPRALFPPYQPLPSQTPGKRRNADATLPTPRPHWQPLGGRRMA